MTFATTLSSPLRRALRTCELAGFGSCAQIDANLVEWNYGDFEGRTSAEINKLWPGWQLFRDGCPGGEKAKDVAQRADRVIERARASSGDVLLFSSGHFLRVFAARWLGLEPTAGRHFMLRTASLSALSYEHDPSQPVIRFWDDNCHLVPGERRSGCDHTAFAQTR
jgi:probable phosphoglycerate mutase